MWHYHFIDVYTHVYTHIPQMHYDCWSVFKLGSFVYICVILIVAWETNQLYSQVMLRCNRPRLILCGQATVVSRVIRFAKSDLYQGFIHDVCNIGAW